MATKRRFDKHSVRLPKSKKAQQEFKEGKKGVLICKQCGIFYYQKGWHSQLDYFKHIEKSDHPVSFVLCPSCDMIKKGQYEGYIKITGTPTKYLDDLVHLAHNFCEKDWERNPLHRLIDIKRLKNNIEITTTENQLAQKLSNKIKQTFKPASVTISHGKGESDVVRIRMKF